MNELLTQTSPGTFASWENMRNTSTGINISLADVYARIIDPNSPYKILTEAITETYFSKGGGKAGKRAIAGMKARLPVVAFSGTGTRKEIDVPSGLICIDLDELGARLEDLRRRFREHPSVALIMRSPSGDGLKVVFRIPFIAHGEQKVMRRLFKKVFGAVSRYVAEQYGIEVDKACCDLLRLCYLPYDSEAFINENAEVFPVEFDESPPTTSTAPEPEGAGNFGRRWPIEIVRPLLFSIGPRPDYPDWLRISAAVRNALGNTDLAIELLREWSPEEEVGEYARILKTRFDEIGIGTLRYFAGKNDFFAVYEQFAYETSRRFFIFRWGDTWVRLNGEGATRDHLRQFVGKLADDCPLCPIRTEFNVEFAGKIAGYGEGIIESNGSRILVLEGPVIIRPSDGQWPVLRRFLESLIPEQGERSMFLAWLQHCRRALVNRRRGQTPALALVGDRGNGKSLLIRIINRCLGGRSASGYRYLSESTPFNADIIGAELLVIDDEAASTDFRTRLKLAQKIKSHFFAETVRLEAKGVDAITVAPIQALVIAVNSDPQHIRVLPELDETMRDKIVLLQTARGELPADLRGSHLLEEVLTQEIPGFLHFLESQDFSGHYESGRLRCHWNPQIVDALCLMSPEMQLLALISATPSLARTHRPGGVVPEFTAAKVQAELMDNAGTKHTASSLLAYQGSCGIYLGKLADRIGSGITRAQLTRFDRIQKYRIDIPGEE